MRALIDTNVLISADLEGWMKPTVKFMTFMSGIQIVGNLKKP